MKDEAKKEPAIIELDPVEWRSERSEKQPFFGKGLAGGLVWLAGFSVMFFVTHYFR